MVLAAKLTTCSLPDDEPVASSCTSAATAASRERYLGWNGTQMFGNRTAKGLFGRDSSLFPCGSNFSAFEVFFSERQRTAISRYTLAR